MKTLKLVGLEAYISPFTKLTVIRKGDTVTVDDELAERLLQGHENARDRGRVDHWQVVGAAASAIKEEEAPALVQYMPTADELEVSRRIAEAQNVDFVPTGDGTVAKPKGQRVARKSASK